LGRCENYGSIEVSLKNPKEHKSALSEKEGITNQKNIVLQTI